MSERYRPVKTAIDDFLTWWWQGLAWLLPATNRRTAEPQTAPAILVQPQAQGFRLSVAGAAHTSTALPMSISVDTPAAAIASWIAGLELANPLLVLRLADHQLLAPQLTVAAGRTADVRAMLGFEIDRQTPFTVDQVYYDYYPLETTAEHPLDNGSVAAPANGLRCGLVVVPRLALDETLATLRPLGIEIDLFDLNAAGYPAAALDLLATGKTALLPGRFRRWHGWLAGGVTLLLLGLMAWLPAASQRAELQQLQLFEQQLRAQAAALTPIRQRRDQLITSQERLAAQRATEHDPLVLLSEITRLLPDNGWLNRFELKQGKLNLQGESANAANLIERFQNSPLISKVQFVSPITSDQRSGRDRFSISMVLNAQLIPTDKLAPNNSQGPQNLLTVADQ